MRLPITPISRSAAGPTARPRSLWLCLIAGQILVAGIVAWVLFASPAGARPAPQPAAASDSSTLRRGPLLDYDHCRASGVQGNAQAMPPGDSEILVGPRTWE